jgi:hypothetical protein
MAEQDNKVAEQNYDEQDYDEQIEGQPSINQLNQLNQLNRLNHLLTS